MSIFSNFKTFRGGVHPPEFKELTRDQSFEIMPDPKRVILPLRQHIGKDAKPLVKKGVEVKAGEIIAESDGFISSPVFSPVNGKVISVGKETNSSGFPKEAIVIETNGSTDTQKLEKLEFSTVTGAEIIERVKHAGIVGQGGAAFPTFVKLTPNKDRIIDYIILNGCECEPYLTRDERLMLDRSHDVVSGLLLMMKALELKKGYIGVEDNKPEAIEAMQKAAATFSDIELAVVRTKYPQGAEKMLIKAVTGREVPPGKLPLDVGVVIQNIGTAVAVYDSVVKGEPQITASVTVSGLGLNNPKNLIVKVGTPLADVLEFCGGAKENAKRVIVGGPMMGFAQYDFSAPIMKATSGILVLTEDEINSHEQTPCLKCGMCVEVCPLNLIPTKLARYSQLDKTEEAENLGISVCMECGTCTYTCPANIPLVQWIRLGKQRVNQMNSEKKTA